MWAQLTSAFYNDGLGGFKAIQDNIVVLLRSITGFLNSTAGAEKVIQVFKVFWDFIEIVKNASKYLFSFFDRFSGVISFWMQLQLYIWPLVKTFTALKSALIGLTVLGQVVGKIGLFSVNLRGLLLALSGGNAANIFKDRLAYMMTGGIDGRKLNLFQPGGFKAGNGVSNPYAPLSGSPSANNGNGGATTVIASGVTTRGGRAPQGNGKFWGNHRTAAVGTGLLSMLGMGLGSYAGDMIGGYFNGEGSSTLGAILGGVGGTALMTSVGTWLSGASAALFSNPIGWSVLAVGALVAVGSAVWKVHKSIDKANELSAKWAKSINNMYLDQIDWTKDNAIMVANMRVTTNGLMDQNNQLKAGIDNWNAWWKAQNRPDEQNNPSNFKPADSAWSIKMDQLIEDADRSTKRTDTWKKHFSSPGMGITHGEGESGRIMFSVPGVKYETTGHNGTVSEEDAAKYALMLMGTSMGTDQNGEDYNPYLTKAIELIGEKVWSTKNIGEWDSSIYPGITSMLPEINHN